jgi:hypothetical protein
MMASLMLRGIALDIYAWNMSSRSFEEHSSEYPSGFWQDLCGAIFEKKRKDM